MTADRLIQAIRVRGLTPTRAIVEALAEGGDTHDTDYSPNFQQIIKDAEAKGMQVSREEGAVYIVARRHKGNNKVLRGMVLYPSGSAFDLTVPALSSAKAIRKLSQIRATLGLD